MRWITPIDLVYNVATGGIYVADLDDNRSLLGHGYSGSGEYRDQPDAEWQIAKGPIPRGVWRIDSAFTHKRLGPCCIPLSPIKLVAGHLKTERSGFFIHGDNGKGDFSASSGCIIAARTIREGIRALAIRSLLVE